MHRLKVHGPHLVVAVFGYALPPALGGNGVQFTVKGDMNGPAPDIQNRFGCPDGQGIQGNLRLYGSGDRIPGCYFQGIPAAGQALYPVRIPAVLTEADLRRDAQVTVSRMLGQHDLGHPVHP